MSTPASTRPCSDEDLLACYDLVFCLPGVSPSSRGPGRGPFKAKTRVRIPLGTYQLPRSRSVVERPQRSLGKRGAALHAPPAVPNPVGDAIAFVTRSVERAADHARSGGPTPRCACHTASTRT